jgi:very-short-patch-repair endonuclease
MLICDYGCGGIGIYKLKSGKNCCSESQNSCSKIKQKNRLAQKERGFKWSDEQKQLMSENRKGNKNGMYGKKHKNETKEKMGNRLLGKTYEELYGKEKATELKDNYSRKMKGRKAWNQGLRGNEYCSEETRKKWSESCSGERNGMYGKRHTEESKERMSFLGKERFKDEDWIKNWLGSVSVKPNNPEKIIIHILNLLKMKNFKYVGDFKFWVGRKNPDFINESDKKIIEHFGRYYHGKEYTKEDTEVHEKKRINYFEKHGFQTLIIWEDEIYEDVEKVALKIAKFGGIECLISM